MAQGHGRKLYVLQSGHGAGTVVFIKKVPLLISLETIHIWTDFGPVKIISVYAPPTRPLSLDDYPSLFAGDFPVLVAGDRHGKHPYWGCRVANGFGSKLFDFT